MSISFDVPSDLERELRAAGVDLDREAKEGFFVGLYRRGRITHDDLSGALGLGFEQTQQLLKDHGVGDDYTLEEFEAERAFLRGLKRP
ncbi:MAG: hypothetical protein BGO49_18445 [Planctomycetales bacterium 71-10]|nr:MAG: hypothetical protein BGO49_18445 [Planctomycetales bacterium 71-10]